MGYADNMKNTLRFVTWNDYRGSKESVVINFESSPSAEMPIRDIGNENGRGAQLEPNLETGTYGYLRCFDGRTRNSFVKNRKGYLLFLTNYQGTEKKYRKRDFIVGYYKITQTADARKQHLRLVEDEPCPEVNFCHALMSRESKFVEIADGFELTVDKLKEWGYKGKLSKQLKLAFNEERTAEVLAHFALKTDATPKYIAEIETAVEKAKKETAVEEEKAT